MIPESVWRTIQQPLVAAVLILMVSSSVKVYGAEFDGYVVLRNVLALKAGVSGRVEADKLVPGARFTKGDELASVEKKLYLGRLNNAVNNLELRRNEAEEADKAFERDEILFDEGSMSLVEFDHAELALQRSKATLQQAESDLATARYAADVARSIAPFNGVVLSRVVSTGEFVNANSVSPLLGKIGEEGKYAIRVSLTAEERQGIEIGTGARVTIGTGTLDATVGALHLVETSVSGPPGWIVEVFFDASGIVSGTKARVDLP